MSALQRLDFIPGDWKLGVGGFCVPVSELGELVFCGFAGLFYLIKKVADSMARSMHAASLCILPCVGYWRCLVFLCCSLSPSPRPSSSEAGCQIAPSEMCFVGSPRGWSSLCKGWCPSAGYHLLFALCRVQAHSAHCLKGFSKICLAARVEICLA